LVSSPKSRLSTDSTRSTWKVSQLYQTKRNSGNNERQLRIEKEQELAPLFKRPRGESKLPRVPSRSSRPKRPSLRKRRMSRKLKLRSKLPRSRSLLPNKRRSSRPRLKKKPELPNCWRSSKKPGRRPPRKPTS
jgi:hypothetical protein